MKWITASSMNIADGADWCRWVPFKRSHRCGECGALCTMISPDVPADPYPTCKACDDDVEAGAVRAVVDFDPRHGVGGRNTSVVVFRETIRWKQAIFALCNLVDTPRSRASLFREYYKAGRLRRAEVDGNPCLDFIRFRRLWFGYEHNRSRL